MVICVVLDFGFSSLFLSVGVFSLVHENASVKRKRSEYVMILVFMDECDYVVIRPSHVKSGSAILSRFQPQRGRQGPSYSRRVVRHASKITPFPRCSELRRSVIFLGEDLSSLRSARLKA